MNVKLGYGYYEMRAQLPAGDGNWPAFWLLPADGAWPPEIDIFEGLANNPTQIYCSVHSTVAFPGNTYQPGANHWAVTYNVDTANTQTGFHTYGLDFKASTLTWYFDGASVASVGTPGDLLDRAVYIVIDNALGGWNGNAVDATTTFPSSYQIDYIRV
jgi:beta-glucanase (GH16 family)